MNRRPFPGDLVLLQGIEFDLVEYTGRAGLCVESDPGITLLHADGKVVFHPAVNAPPEVVHPRWTDSATAAVYAQKQVVPLNDPVVQRLRSLPGGGAKS